MMMRASHKRTRHCGSCVFVAWTVAQEASKLYQEMQLVGEEQLVS